MRHPTILAAATLLVLAGAALAGEGAVYGVHNHESGADLYTLDRHGGFDEKHVGSTGFDRVLAMDYDDAGRLFAVALRDDGQAVLARIDDATGAGSEVGVLADSWLDEVRGMSFDASAGTFWVYDVDGDLFEVDPDDAGVSLIDLDNASGCGIAFSPGGALFLVKSRYLYERQWKTSSWVIWPVESLTGYWVDGMAPMYDVGLAHAMDFDPETGLIHASAALWISYGYWDDDYITIDPVTYEVDIVGSFRKFDALAVCPNRAPVITSMTVTPPRVSVTDGTVDLAVTAHDPDDNPLTYDWDLGDGETASGATVSHTYSSPGEYTVTVSVSDGVLDDEEWDVVEVGTPPEIRAITLDPPAAAATEEIRFSVTTFDREGDDLLVSWDLGDGSAATGSTATHTYAQDGVYSVMVTVDDGLDAVAETRRVIVGQAVESPKLVGRLNFKKTGKDRVTFGCRLWLPDGFVAAGSTVDLDFGGVVRSYVLDAKAKAKDSTGKVSLKFKRKKQLWQLAVTLKKGSFADAWVDEGLTDSTQKKTPVAFTTSIVVGGVPCFARTDLLYTAKAGKFGRLKSVR